MNGLAVTNARILGFAGQQLDTKGPALVVDADNISSYEFEKKFSGPHLVVTTQARESLVFGAIHKDEIEFVRHYLDWLVTTGFPVEVREAIRAHEVEVAAQQAAAQLAVVEQAEAAAAAERELAAKKAAEKAREEAAAKQAAAAAAAQAERELAAKKAAARAKEEAAAKQAAAAAQAEQEVAARRNSVDSVGSPLKDKGWNTIHDHAAEGELPWFILNNGSAGFLAAFEDRLIIAKVGGMAGFMTGSLGGGRVTTFPYTDITNIEYNSGMVNGVLEVLTPSYQGTGNHDYWRSSNKSSNRASDSPWTLSNCLPLQKVLHKQALPQINELQRRIADAKRPQVVVQHVPQPAPATAPVSGLAEELQQIANLHSQGLLDAEEFAAAKRAAIAKHSNH